MSLRVGSAKALNTESMSVVYATFWLPVKNFARLYTLKPKLVLVLARRQLDHPRVRNDLGKF